MECRQCLHHDSELFAGEFLPVSTIGNTTRLLLQPSTEQRSHSVEWTSRSTTEMDFHCHGFAVFLDKLWKFHTYRRISGLTCEKYTKIA